MKKTLSIFLCLVAVAVTLCSCKSIKNKDAVAELTYTDAQGKTFMYATDENGEAVTDENGEKVTTTSAEGEVNGQADGSESKNSLSLTLPDNIKFYKTDENGENVLDEDGNPIVDTGKKAEIEKNLQEAEKGNAVPKNSDDKKATTGNKNSGAKSSEDVKKDLLDEGTKAANTTLRKTVIEPVIKSGTFTIKGSMIVEGMNASTTFAVRNSKDYSVSMEIMGIALRMFSNNGKYYIAIPLMNAYSEVSEEEFEGMNGVGDLSEAFGSKNDKYIKTTTVKDGGVTYTCEEYEADGVTYKYYFNPKNEWKRMEVIDGDEVMIWKIDSFKNTVDNKLFEVSKTWKKRDDITSLFG